MGEHRGMDHAAFGLVAFVAATALFGVGYGILIAPLRVLATAPDGAIAVSIVTGAPAGLGLYAE